MANQSASGVSQNTVIFHASTFWKLNLIGAYFAGLVGAAWLLLLGLSLERSGRQSLGVSILIVECGGLLLGLLAYFPGGLGAMWPYAVEIRPNEGLRLVAPLKEQFIPTRDLLDIELSSSLFGGYNVRLAKQHRLLTQFVIPRLFGTKGRELRYAIDRLISANE